MTNKLRQAVDKIISLSRTSTLCAYYTNGIITISFKIDDILNLTKQSSGESFSIWCSNEGMATPTGIEIKYADIISVEFVTQDEMSNRSNGECNIEAFEMKLVDGSKLTIFEDIA